MHVAILGTYPPTRCGIATFTADVERSLLINGATVTVVPVECDGSPSADSIERDDPASYLAAARHLNAIGCDVVLVEHEFGIFGGPSGSHLMGFVDALEIPVVITLHTVLPNFSPDQSRVVQAMCARAAGVTVFTNSARQLLLEQELVPAHLVHIVAHGAPTELFEAIETVDSRKGFGLPPGVPVMSTFGLLSDGKGIETAIEAMALLSERLPDLHYVVAGRTHPEIVKREGERYRHGLADLVAERGLENRVVFADKFLDLEELASLLAISDLVCTPYRGEQQSVSGVLTFALAAGCPIVSTPYRYARDVLAEGAGVIVDFGDVEGYADAIFDLLSEEGGAAARLAARRASTALEWPTVGAAILNVLATAAPPVPVLASPRPSVAAQLIPTLGGASVPAEYSTNVTCGTSHLRVLCDDTGMLQHGHLRMARHEEGYCVDDAGRMLPIATQLAASTGDGSWALVAARLIAYLRAANRDGGGAAAGGSMRNFMSYDRRWLDEPHGGDHVGRAVWGLGEVVAQNGLFAEEASFLLDEIVPAISPSWPTRTIAYAALGLAAAATTEPRRDEDLDRLSPAFHTWTPSPDPDWSWCEQRLSYDNARIAETLIRVGSRLGDEDLVDNGVVLLRWLERLCRRGEHYRFPGHRGLSDVRQLGWSGDEQPLEAAAHADAHAAWLGISGERSSRSAIERSWSWFLGNNRLAEPMCDLTIGAGFDGLCASGVNRNCGAESTIALHRCQLTRMSVLTTEVAETVTDRNGRVHWYAPAIDDL